MPAFIFVSVELETLSLRSGHNVFNNVIRSMFYRAYKFTILDFLEINAFSLQKIK